MGKFTMMFSAVPIHKHASAKAAMIIRDKWKHKLYSYNEMNEIIITGRFKVQRGYVNTVCAYSPEKGSKDETKQF